MSGPLLTAIITAVFGAPLLAVLNYVFNRKRATAETESIHMKTALELHASMSRTIGELEASVTELRQENAAIRRRERIRDRREAKHENWDYRVVEKLKAHGIDIDEPPPLGSDADDPDGPRTRAEDFGLPGTARTPHSERRTT